MSGQTLSTRWKSLLPRLQEALAPRYEVLHLIGFGGMAGVYLAKETKLDRRVAIKVIEPSLVMDPSFVARFEQEARATARLRHSNIVTLFEVDHRGDFLFIAMSFCPGRTLGDVLKGSVGRIPPTVVRAWLYEIASALDHAHHHGIVHRDIKPGNILLDDEGRSMVTDFGIAKVGDQPNLTSTGMLIGTPTYMSPEQCSGEEVGSSSDQYSLGIVAYELLTGKPPFIGTTPKLLVAHAGLDPLPIGEVVSDCPPDLAAAVMRMLAKDPADRWPSLTEAVKAGGGGPVQHGDELRSEMSTLARRISALRVSTSEIELTPSQEFTLQVEALDFQNTPLPGRLLKWVSSAIEVATVASDGTVTAVSPGTATLSVRGGGVAQSIIVEVSEVSGTISMVFTEQPLPFLEPVAGDATIVADTSMLESMQEASVEGERVASGEEAAAPPATAGTTPRLETSASATLFADPPVVEAEAVKAPVVEAPAVEASAVVASDTAVQKSPRKMGLVFGGLGAVAVAALAFVFLRGGLAGPEQGVASIVVEPPEATLEQPIINPTTVAFDSAQVDSVVGGEPDLAASPLASVAENTSTPGPQTARPEVIVPITPAAPRPGSLVLQGAFPVGARVAVTGGDNRTVNLTGTTSLPAGRYRLVATAPGYERVETTVVLAEGGAQRWRPTWTLVPTAPPEPAPTESSAEVPAVLGTEDIASIHSAIDEFVTAFAQRNLETLLPLLPPRRRGAYETLLGLDYSRFEVTRDALAAPNFDGDKAVVSVPLTIRSVSSGVSQEASLPFMATLTKQGGRWVLESMVPR